jgi:ATP-binding cassette subfamily B protein
VSERIGADLRTTTYEHLLRLSLEYFGGKRTGDLMARIGSETDRINVFLSLHLLDFATDVLMIVMTAPSCSRSTRGWRWSPCCRCRSSAG